MRFTNKTTPIGTRNFPLRNGPRFQQGLRCSIWVNTWGPSPPTGRRRKKLITSWTTRHSIWFSTPSGNIHPGWGPTGQGNPLPTMDQLTAGMVENPTNPENALIVLRAPGGMGAGVGLFLQRVYDQQENSGQFMDRRHQRRPWNYWPVASCQQTATSTTQATRKRRPLPGLFQRWHDLPRQAGGIRQRLFPRSMELLAQTRPTRQFGWELDLLWTESLDPGNGGAPPPTNILKPDPRRMKKLGGLRTISRHKRSGSRSTTGGAGGVFHQAAATGPRAGSFFSESFGPREGPGQWPRVPWTTPKTPAHLCITRMKMLSQTMDGKQNPPLATRGVLRPGGGPKPGQCFSNVCGAVAFRPNGRGFDRDGSSNKNNWDPPPSALDPEPSRNFFNHPPANRPCVGSSPSANKHQSFERCVGPCRENSLSATVSRFKAITLPFRH